MKLIDFLRYYDKKNSIHIYQVLLNRKTVKIYDSATKNDIRIEVLHPYYIRKISFINDCVVIEILDYNFNEHWEER